MIVNAFATPLISPIQLIHIAMHHQLGTTAVEIAMGKDARTRKNCFRRRSPETAQVHKEQAVVVSNSAIREPEASQAEERPGCRADGRR